MSIKLAPGTILTGTVQNEVTVKGAPGSMFFNTGASTAQEVDLGVFGHGTWTVSGQMEFGGYVGPQQTVEDSGTLVIDQPHSFAGNVDLNGTTASIDLKNIGHIDGYVFQNDDLYLMLGAKVVDMLRMDASAASYGFDVIQAPGSSDVFINSDDGGLSVHPANMVPHTTLLG
jgi:hypothetical protein